jgi:hypothetical protein
MLPAFADILPVRIFQQSDRTMTQGNFGPAGDLIELDLDVIDRRERLSRDPPRIGPGGTGAVRRRREDISQLVIWQSSEHQTTDLEAKLMCTTPKPVLSCFA